jgi:hypothetical protein
MLLLLLTKQMHEVCLHELCLHGSCRWLRLLRQALSMLHLRLLLVRWLLRLCLLLLGWQCKGASWGAQCAQQLPQVVERVGVLQAARVSCSGGGSAQRGHGRRL